MVDMILVHFFRFSASQEWIRKAKVSKFLFFASVSQKHGALSHVDKIKNLVLTKLNKYKHMYTKH